MKNELLTTAKKYLLKNKGNWREIAEEAGVSYPAIKAIMTERSLNPSVNVIEDLLKYAGLFPGQKPKKAKKRM